MNQNKIQESIDQVTSIQSELEAQQGTQTNSDQLTQKPVIIQSSNEILSMALSPNGKYIASAGGGDYSIRIWDLVTGNQVGKPLKGHTGLIGAIKYSKCGTSIVSGSFDETIRQWNVLNQKQMGETMAGHRNIIMDIDYSQDQKYIISCSLDATIRFWDLKTGKEFATKRIEHIKPLYCLVISPIQNEVAISDATGTITIFNHQRKYSRQQIHTNDAYVNTIKYSLDGKLILTASEDKFVRIWDLSRRKQIRSYVGHTSTIFSVGFSCDQKYIISGGDDRTVRIWNRMTGKQIGESLTHHVEKVYSTQFSLCSNYIITGGYDGQIKKMLVPMGQ